LLVYETQHGQTAKIAQHVRDSLARAGHAVELIEARDIPGLFDLLRFDFVVVAAPIHSGGYPRSVVRFVRQNHEFLSQVPSAFLSVGLAVLSRTADGRTQTLVVVEKFLKQTGWRPARVELVAGALPYSKYNFLVRLVMRRISASEGGDTDTSHDYEYTDWAALDRLARDLVEPTVPGITKIGPVPAR
jgi:menaquinone-dependent protoporphyrinogen oxidase